jgi:hypothetical protein
MYAAGSHAGVSCNNEVYNIHAGGMTAGMITGMACHGNPSHNGKLENPRVTKNEFGRERFACKKIIDCLYYRFYLQYKQSVIGL